MKKEILKITLLNAVTYNGKASVGSVVGKLMGEHPELKSKIKEIMKEINETVNEVNSWTIEKQKKELSNFKIIKKEKKKEKYQLPNLPNAENGKVITVFPPEPSKYSHIGHAKASWINYLYAKKYNGKFILRFEDTNPEKVKLEYYNQIKNELKWLGIKWDRIDYASDYMQMFYNSTEKLIRNEKAYVCCCKPGETSKHRMEQTCCECRGNSIDENLELWKKMLEGKTKQGEYSVRLKISMSHKNTAMRDPSIMRVINKQHPRLKEKYYVYPMYDFATSVMDGIEKITHRVRSKEFELRADVQKFIQKNLDIKSPIVKEIARFNLEGVPSSGRIIREMIEKKEISGWDDPKLTTLIALKRRGFIPEAIQEFLVSTGFSKSESTLTWDVLESVNRKYVDKIANRYFAVKNPIKIKIEGAKEIYEVRENRHQEFLERGQRKIPVYLDEIYISKQDFEELKGKEIRLLGLFNVKLDKISKYTGDEVKREMPKIQWISKENVEIEIITPEEKIKYLAEPEVSKLRIDDKLQFMRLGFYRLDSIKPLRAYLTHK